MSGELKFKDVKVGDKIANRYVLESVVNADNGEAAVFMCDYEGWKCMAKVYYDDVVPDKATLDAQIKVTSSHLVRKMDKVMYNNHYCQIMPTFKGSIMTKPVNDKLLLETIIPGVIDALKAVHEAGIMHGCVKPNNIFYSPMGDDVLLGDFGVSLDHVGECSKNIAMNYLPPETQNGVYDEKADYYSLGIALVQLITNGKSPFEGMNMRAMIKAAATTEFELPAKASPILLNIIKGLTIKDHDTRWGSEEVEKALAGEDVPIVDNFVYVPPENEFYFEDVRYTDLAELVTAFSDKWSLALEAIKSPSFNEFVDGLNENMAMIVRETLSDADENQALFKLLYVSNPDLPFCWKGLKSVDLVSFADGMKRADDKEPYRVALADGALLAYEQFRGADDDTVSSVARLSDDANSGVDAAIIAFKLDYMLSGQFVYNMDGIPFSDVSTFTSYIQMNVSELNELCHEFINDARFFAWLDVLGYADQVAEWRAGA